PALRSLHQERQIVRWKIAAQRGMEKGRRLGDIKTELGGAYLHQQASRSQACKGQRWIGACGQHQVQLGWQAVEQEGHSLMYGLRLDEVIVIEHKRKVV